MPETAGELALWSFVLSVCVATITGVGALWKETRTRNRLLREYQIDLESRVADRVDIKFAEVLLRNFTALRDQEERTATKMQQLDSRHDDLLSLAQRFEAARQLSIEQIDLLSAHSQQLPNTILTAPLHHETEAGAVTDQEYTSERSRFLGRSFSALLYSTIKQSEINWSFYLFLQSVLYLELSPSSDPGRQAFIDQAYTRLGEAEKALMEQKESLESYLEYLEV